MKKKSIAIICGGGPALGINMAISTTAKVFLKDASGPPGCLNFQLLFSATSKILFATSDGGVGVLSNTVKNLEAVLIRLSLLLYL